MRWALALCVVAGSTMMGRALTLGARRRVTLLTGLIRGLEDLRAHMTRMLEPAAQALGFTDCPLLRLIGAAMAPGVSAREAWSKVCAAENRRGMDALVQEDREVLDQLFEHLGESGREQQNRLLGEAARRLRENLEDACARAGEAERLYGTLGLLLGLMLALIVV